MKLGVLGNPLVRWVIGIIILVGVLNSPGLQAALEAWFKRAELQLVAVSATLGLLGVAYGLAHLYSHAHHDQGKRQIIGSIVAAVGLGTLAQWFPLAMAVGTFLIGLAAQVLGALPGAGH